LKAGRAVRRDRFTYVVALDMLVCSRQYDVAAVLPRSAHEPKRAGLHASPRGPSGSLSRATGTGLHVVAYLSHYWKPSSQLNLEAQQIGVPSADSQQQRERLDECEAEFVAVQLEAEHAQTTVGGQAAIRIDGTET
jgi:hypothetical protein